MGADHPAPGATAPVSAAAVLGDAEFNFLRQFVLDHCGISLSEQKRQLVQGRLARRLRVLKLRGYQEYCQLLRDRPEAELDELSSVISTNVTAFFREPHHFDYLAEELLPRWLKSPHNGRIRLWSAGCSSGEEPYSLAMVLAEALERHGRPVDALILATDLSPQALAAARLGHYTLDHLKGIDEHRRRRWLLRGTGSRQGQFCVHPRLRELVRVQPLNLLHAWPMRGAFDAIFCRNVMIYFDKPTKQRLFQRFASVLRDEGHLFLGHSESMHGLATEFGLIGKTIYQRKGA